MSKDMKAKCKSSLGSLPSIPARQPLYDICRCWFAGVTQQHTQPHLDFKDK